MKCSGCKEEKNMDDFQIRSDTGKPRGQCRECKRKYLKNYEKENKISISERKKRYRDENLDVMLTREKHSRDRNKTQRAEYNKKYSEDHINECEAYRKKYNILNKESISVKRKVQRAGAGECGRKIERARYHKNKKHIRATRRKRHKERVATEPLYRLRHALRARMHCVLRNKKESSLEYIGCAITELKKYLEDQFYPHLQTGEEMNWSNHGLYGWHIDHIIPLATVKDTKDIDQIKKVCHYTNLQPLWAKENLTKGARIPEEK